MSCDRCKREDNCTVTPVTTTSQSLWVCVRCYFDMQEKGLRYAHAVGGAKAVSALSKGEGTGDA